MPVEVIVIAAISVFARATCVIDCNLQRFLKYGKCVRATLAFFEVLSRFRQLSRDNKTTPVVAKNR